MTVARNIVILPPAPRQYDQLDQNAVRSLVERALSTNFLVALHADTHETGGVDPIDVNNIGTLQIVNLEADATASRLFLTSLSDVLSYSALQDSDLAAINHDALAGLGDDDHTQYLRHDGTRALSADWAAGAFNISTASLKLGDGAAATPSLAWTSKTNTGLFYSGAAGGDVAVTVNGTERMRIADGVHIGSSFTTPFTNGLRVEQGILIEVNGIQCPDGSAGAPSFTFFNANDTGFWLASTAPDHIGISIQGFEKGRWDLAGLHVGNTYTAPPSGGIRTEGQIIVEAGGADITGAVLMSSTLGVTGVVSFANYLLFTHATEAGMYRGGVDNSYLGFSGGSAATTGANLSFYGSTHATNASDMLFRNGATLTLQYDASETRWEFKHAVTMDLTLGVTGLLTASAGLFLGGHITPDTDLAYTCGVAGAVFSNVYARQFLRGSTTDSFTCFGGGLDSTVGPNMIMYGTTHATVANDILFRIGTTTKLRWDNSDGRWEFTALAQSSSSFRSEIASDNVHANAGFLANVQGGRATVGPSAGGTAGTFGSAQHTDAAVLNYRTYWAYDSFWDDANDQWVASRTTLGRKWMQDMGYHNNTWRVRYFDGTVSAPWADSAWTNLLSLNSSGDLSLAGAITITGGLATFSADVRVNNDIYQSVAASFLRISGGDGADQGANVIFYADDHATLANDINFRYGSTSILLWDYSDSRWEVLPNGTIGVDAKITFGASRATVGYDGTLIGTVLDSAAGKHTYLRAESDTYIKLRYDTTTIETMKAITLYHATIAVSGITEVQINEQTRLDSTALIGNFRADGRAGFKNNPNNSTTGYGLLCDTTTTYLNAPTSLNFRVGNAEKATMSATLWTVNIDMAVAGALYKTAATGIFVVSGGSSSALGANLELYGESHASAAGDWNLRDDVTDILSYDASAALVSSKIAFEVAANFTHTGTSVGFYSVAATARPAAFTQTYATATRTHSNPTAAALTDSTAGTATQVIAAVSGSGDDTTINDNLASLTDEINKLITDLANAKQVLNQMLDDLQLNGLLQ
jgi:hypothetical protein